MTASKWNPPSIMDVSLRLQRLSCLLQQQELEERIKRATNLLQSQIERAKRNGELGDSQD